MPANENQGHPRKLTAKGSYIMVFCSSPILLIFGRFGDLYRGIGAWFCAYTVLAVIRMRWDLRRQVWFWITIVFVAFWQVPLVLFLPWESNNARIIFFPVMLLDYGVVYGCVKLVENAMKGAKPPDERVVLPSTSHKISAPILVNRQKSLSITKYTE